MCSWHGENERGRSPTLAYAILYVIYSLFVAPDPSAIVRISNEDGDAFYGTAFYIGDDGYLLSSNHALEEYADDVIFYVNGSPVSVIARDSDADLALLHDERTPAPVGLSLADSASVGDIVRVIGYAAAGDGPVSITLGTVTDTDARALYDDTAHIRLRYDTRGSPGMSGSPVLNIAGEVVGVHVSSTRGKTQGHAVRIEDIRNFLRENDIDLPSF